MAKHTYVVELEQRRFYSGEAKNNRALRNPDYRIHVENPSVEDRNGRMFQTHSNGRWMGVSARSDAASHFVGNAIVLAALAAEMNYWIIENDIHPDTQVALNSNGVEGTTLDVIFPKLHGDNGQEWNKFVEFWEGRAFEFNGRTNIKLQLTAYDLPKTEQEAA